MTLIDHLDPDYKKEFPEFIYHYTKFENFLKILESKTFYLFSSDQMNDYKENIAIREVLKNVINQKKLNIPDDHLKKLNEFMENKTNKGITYISCFTELRDSLSQWWGYGDNGNGICLVIDPKNLEIEYNLSSQPIESCLLFHNVIYSKEEQEKLIEEMLKFAFAYSDNSDNNEYFILLLKELIDIFAPIFKVNEFKDEKEWRIIYLTMIDSRTDFGFIPTHNNLKLYFPLIIDEAKFINSVKGVILGPKNIIPHPYTEISILLKRYGFENTKIEKSNIPYR